MAGDNPTHQGQLEGRWTRAASDRRAVDDSRGISGVCSHNRNCVGMSRFQGVERGRERARNAGTVDSLRD
jgi:hypothetical protein